MVLKYLVAIIIAYFLGSIPFAYILVKKFSHKDIRTVGSGNVGSTNTMRVLGKKGFLAVFCFDICKGFLAAYIGLKIGGQYLGAITGAVAVLGHIFPVWLKFKGGKGAACGFGFVLAIMPIPAVVGFLCWLIVLVLTRYVSLSTILGGFVVFVASIICKEGLFLNLLTCVIVIVVIFMHRSNIKRILNGTEMKFGQKI